MIGVAERRMFAKTIIDSDPFLDMPLSAQALYFHLGMRADDDGFINNPKKIQRVVGCSGSDMELLIERKFLIPFDSGVVAIKHWKIHNYIRADRYKETVYKEEKARLALKKNGSYTLGIPTDNHTTYQGDTQDRVGKDRVGKVRSGEERKTATASTEERQRFGTYKNVLLTADELQALKEKFPENWSERLEHLSSYMSSAGKNYANHFATICLWAEQDRQKDSNQKTAKQMNESAWDYVAKMGKEEP